jgi:2-keto-4-pentenoate hydratase
MTNDEVRQLASGMVADDDAGNPGRLFSGPVELTTPQAYALQDEVARLREQRGERLIGYKVGCVSRVIQEQLGIDQPIFGRIFDTGCSRSGVQLSHSRYVNLAVECELAIRLVQDVPDPLTPDWDHRQVIESIFPVIELHQYVLRDVRPSCPALVACNGMHAGLVLADEETPCSEPAHGIRELSIRIGDEEVGTTAEPWALGSPRAALHWLAGRLRASGLCLLRGQVILTGSPMRLFPVSPNCRIVVEARPGGISRAEIVL